MIDINKMRRLAQAATPGPWVAAGPSFGESLPKYLNEVAVDREGDEDDGYSICNAPIGLNEECSDDMAFIAEANPLTIEELLDRLEAAEKERDVLKAKIERMEKQEPVAWAATDETCRIVEALSFNQSRRFDTPLYALPGAQPKDEALWPTIANGMITQDGWKLVPIVSTDEMDNAGSEHCDGYLSTAQVVWDAMLAAAPEANQ